MSSAPDTFLPLFQGEVEELCTRYQGFLRVGLAEPLPDRAFYRRGWVSFKRDVNIKDIAWNMGSVTVSSSLPANILMWMGSLKTLEVSVSLPDDYKRRSERRMAVAGGSGLTLSEDVLWISAALGGLGRKPATASSQVIAIMRDEGIQTIIEASKSLEKAVDDCEDTYVPSIPAP